ncbi:hypothetical protein TB2_043104 [Malus domestica]
MGRHMVDEQALKKGKDSKGFYTETSEEMMLMAYVDIEEVDINELWYMEQPTKLHLKAAKKMLRYLKDTMSFGLFYKKGGNEELIRYTDGDYAGDQDDRKSTSGYVFMLSSGEVS